MEPLFQLHAPVYYERGLSVIPLAIRSKRPVIVAWSHYSRELPEEALFESWLEKHPYNNMGLVLGEQSNISVIDVDNDDEAIKEALETAGAPPSPWIRVGAKGYVLAYKFNPNVRAFKIKNSSQQMLVEHLSTGNQIVLPPSIHPDTQKPYKANLPLLTIIDDLQPLPDDFEKRLRNTLNQAGVKLASKKSLKIADSVPKGTRDITMTEHAGYWAHVVMRGERSLMEALGEFKAWFETQVENDENDPIDIKKGLVRSFNS